MCAIFSFFLILWGFFLIFFKVCYFYSSDIILFFRHENKLQCNKAVKFHNNHAPLISFPITYIINATNNAYYFRKKLLTRETYLQEIAAN